MRDKLEQHKSLLIIVAVLMSVLIGRFIYFNIVVPAPYKEQLDECLVQARQQTNEEEVKLAENICFRIYPHFN